LRHVWIHRLGLGIFSSFLFFQTDFNPSTMQIFLIIYHLSPLSRNLLFLLSSLLCLAILFCPVIVLYKNRGTDKFIQNCEKRLSPKIYQKLVIISEDYFIDFSPCSTMQHIHSMTTCCRGFVSKTVNTGRNTRLFQVMSHFRPVVCIP
jgi:ABC-type bacteriocin/lantibiotic exporter with double-glycine peptidase domain